MRRSIGLPLLIVVLMVTVVGLLRLAAPNGSVVNVPTTLDATYTSADGTLTFNYPTGWLVREAAGQIFLATSDQIMQSTGSSAPVTPGQFVAGILVFPAARVPGLTAEAGPLDVLSAFAPFLSGASETAGDSSIPTFGQANEITIGSRRAARAEGVSGGDTALLITLEVAPQTFVIMAAGSAPGELASFEPALLAIADTMQYSAPAADTPQPEATADVSD